MARKTQLKNKKKSSRRYAAGDVPRPAVRTYHTASCSVPRATETCLVRSLFTSTVTASASANQAPVYVFSLTTGAISAGFFDQYKIEAVRFSVVPNQNALGLTTNSTTSLVAIGVVLDYDDASALGSLTAAQLYNNCIMLEPGESCERVFKPRMAVATYTGGAFSGFANMADEWCDAASPGVQHYGAKIFVPQATVAQTQLQSWTVVVEYFVSFRKAI